MIKFYEKHKKPILFMAGALVIFFIIAVIANGSPIYSVNG